MSGVIAVIVTWNRLDRLRECLAAVCRQTSPVESILVVDNASTDGTRGWLAVQAGAEARLRVLTTQRNLGGAGGFFVGMAEALSMQADWVWVMDDDTVPSDDALERLLAGIAAHPVGQRPLIAASRVDWTDGLPHPMNWPNIRHGHREDQDLFCRCLALGQAPLRAATYVSLLIAAEALRVTGLPRADYFLWADDIDHTLRLCTQHRGVFIPASRVEHRTRDLAIWCDAPPARFFFHVRNGFWNIRFNPGLTPADRKVWRFFHVVGILRYLGRRWWRPAAWRATLRGCWQGLGRRPRPNPSDHRSLLLPTAAATAVSSTAT